MAFKAVVDNRFAGGIIDILIGVPGLHGAVNLHHRGIYRLIYFLLLVVRFPENDGAGKIGKIPVKTAAQIHKHQFAPVDFAVGCKSSQGRGAVTGGYDQTALGYFHAVGIQRMHGFRQNLTFPDSGPDALDGSVHGISGMFAGHPHAFEFFAVLDHLGGQDALVAIYKFRLRKGFFKFVQHNHGHMVDTDFAFGDSQFFKSRNQFFTHFRFRDSRILHGRQRAHILFFHPVHTLPASFDTATGRKQNGILVRCHDRRVTG